MEPEKCVDMCAISGGSFMVQASESLVNFPNFGRFDKEKDGLEGNALVVLINKLGPMTGWDGDEYVVEQVIAWRGGG